MQFAWKLTVLMLLATCVLTIACTAYLSTARPRTKDTTVLLQSSSPTTNPARRRIRLNSSRTPENATPAQQQPLSHLLSLPLDERDPVGPSLPTPQVKLRSPSTLQDKPSQATALPKPGDLAERLLRTIEEASPAVE